MSDGRHNFNDEHLAMIAVEIDALDFAIDHNGVEELEVASQRLRELHEAFFARVKWLEENRHQWNRQPE